MPLQKYGVWVAYPISYEAERASDDSESPHISLYFDDTAHVEKGRYRAAINVKSITTESRLVYWFDRNFRKPIVDHLQSLDIGFHVLPPEKKQGLDYIRGNLMAFSHGTLVRHDVEGKNNDIIDYMSPILDHAIAKEARIFLFGEPFPRGIHDVHMNQGNEGRFKKDNGVWQDGGIILEFPDGHFEAIFLAFAVQKIHTDDETGSPIGAVDFTTLLTGQITPAPQPPTHGEVPPPPMEPVLDGAVLIKAALVNPTGPDQSVDDQPETVYLHNRTSSVVQLGGWIIVNRQGQRQELDGSLQPLGERVFPVPQCPLSNKGGTITLLNSSGLKVDGVSYTSEQARREGVFLYFH